MELQEIFLTYIAPYHYNAIRRRTRSLPRVFSLGRSQSDIERALKKAEQDGLPRARGAKSPVHPPANIPQTVLELAQDSPATPLSQPGRSANGLHSPFAM